MYTGKYKDMQLIDRKKLLEELGYRKPEEIGEAWDNATIEEGEMFTLQAIFDAEEIDPVDIVIEYEANIEKERKTNP